MSTVRKAKRIAAPAVEWSMGRLELGRVIREGRPEMWQLEDPSHLYWYGPTGEGYWVGDLAGASNRHYERGWEALAHIQRPVSKQLPPRVRCFVEVGIYETHYVTNAGDERECRKILDTPGHRLDPDTFVLCRSGLGDDIIAVLPVRANDPNWIATAYRLRREAIDLRSDITDPDVRVNVRRLFETNQNIRDRFVGEEFADRRDAVCCGLVRFDGELSASTDGCSFSGLVATPSPEVSARLLREMDMLD